MTAWPIEDHGIIGDLHTAALVALDGTIDFLCFPRFDSPSVFAGLLDPERGGRFAFGPVGETRARRQFYLPDTNVLMTRASGGGGVTELIDLMPVDEAGLAHNLVRRLKMVRGRTAVALRCRPAFDYARSGHRAHHAGDTVVFEPEAPGITALRLRSNLPLGIENGAAVARAELASGEEAWAVLEPASAGEHGPCSGEGYGDAALEATVKYWQRWIARSTYRGRWKEMVDRSALALKLLTSVRHGSLIAAPTFGLPEDAGGVRNWDYRFTWIRDAAFTLYGFSRLGMNDETQAFFHWLERICMDQAPDEPLQIMYGLDGRRELDETVLDHLAGYGDARPVRIGNAAHGQLQLDIYGELMDAAYLFDKYGTPTSVALWRRLAGLADWVAANWDQPDEGIWEVRGGRRDFLYSRIQCWVALDRAVRLARKRSLPGPIDGWRRTRDAIYAQILREFWDDGRGTFVQAKGAHGLDASTLIMPLVRLISPTDPMWLSTLDAIQRDLVEDSFVYRYRDADGLDGDEGTFSMCTFWYVECLSRAGRLDEARFVFEKMLSHANRLGLYAEELGPCGEHLGNFPQAFTHLSLISAAFDLDRRLGGGGARG
jgi:GH15 family glucan-1,4-alpha-glucosidase